MDPDYKFVIIAFLIFCGLIGFLNTLPDSRPRHMNIDVEAGFPCHPDPEHACPTMYHYTQLTVPQAKAIVDQCEKYQNGFCKVHFK